MTRIESSCGHESLSILLRYACNRLSVLALIAAVHREATSDEGR